LAGWTRFIIRHRKKVIAAWAAACVLGGSAAAGLSDAYASPFSWAG